MDGAKLLTRELAQLFLEQCLTDKFYISISTFTAIEDAAAETLARRTGRLYLCSLTSLSDAAAESLSKHEGQLYLEGLTSLSDTAAESLSKHKGRLILSGLTSLSDAAAESLSKHKEGLDLSGLTSLSDAAAESFSKHEEGLNLNGLISLSDAAAESLSKHKEWISLHGLRNLSYAAADIILHQRRDHAYRRGFGGSLTLAGIINDMETMILHNLERLDPALRLKVAQVIEDGDASLLGRISEFANRARQLELEELEPELFSRAVEAIKELDNDLLYSLINHHQHSPHALEVLDNLKREFELLRDDVADYYNRASREMPSGSPAWPVLRWPSRPSHQGDGQS